MNGQVAEVNFFSVEDGLSLSCTPVEFENGQGKSGQRVSIHVMQFKFN